MKAIRIAQSSHKETNTTNNSKSGTNSASHISMSHCKSNTNTTEPQGNQHGEPEIHQHTTTPTTVKLTQSDYSNNTENKR